MTLLLLNQKLIINDISDKDEKFSAFNLRYNLVKMFKKNNTKYNKKHHLTTNVDQSLSKSYQIEQHGKNNTNSLTMQAICKNRKKNISKSVKNEDVDFFSNSEYTF